MRWDQPIPKSEHIVPAIALSTAMGCWFGASCGFVVGLGTRSVGSPNPIPEAVYNALFGVILGAWIGCAAGLAASPALAFAFIRGISRRQHLWLVILTTSASIASPFVPVAVDLVGRCIGFSVAVYIALCILLGLFARRTKQLPPARVTPTA